jgi:acetyl-CoA acetyltransferase family protein
MREVVIVEAVRTPVGRHGGALAAVRPDDLAALVIGEVVGRAGIELNLVEDVYLGCTNQAGEDNRNVARMALLLAGLPFSVAGATINRLCASGLEAINQAARAIKCGEGDVFVAGGVESMSRAPWSVPKAARAFPWGNVTMYDTTIGWRYPNPRMEQIIPLEGMGQTAENIHDETGISREEQDAFALESQRRAAAAIEAGRFKDEIVPVSVPQRKRASPH